MGIVKGSHFYLHLITQKRPEYIIGIRPPYNEEDNLISHSFNALGNQELKIILHRYNEEDNLISHTSKPLGNQEIRDIFHTYQAPPDNLIYHTFKPLGNQELKAIFHSTNSEDNLISHTIKPLGNQEIRFAVLYGQNRFDGDEDKDRWQHNFGLLGNQELREV